MDHDMDMDMGSSSTSMMINYLHFSPTSDPIWFKEWAPSSVGAVVGACIGLFVLAIIERLLSAMKGVMESWWRKKTEALLCRKYAVTQLPRGRPSSASTASTQEKADLALADTESNTHSATSSPAPPPMSIRRVLPPFIISHDFARGGLRVLQTFIGYALMLAVMTFNASYIISILMGTFAGELLFGRFASMGDHV